MSGTLNRTLVTLSICIKKNQSAFIVLHLLSTVRFYMVVCNYRSFSFLCMPHCMITPQLCGICRHLGCIFFCQHNYFVINILVHVSWSQYKASSKLYTLEWKRISKQKQLYQIILLSAWYENSYYAMFSPVLHVASLLISANRVDVK
jgi:hypothetical protein